MEIENNSTTESLVLKKISKNKNKLSKFYTYLLYFLMFSFLGWLMETAYSFYELGHFTKRGFLYGPLCPIYGWGALILIMFLGKYKGKSIKLFVYAAIVFSAFEYLVGYGMDALFSAKWWDYTNEFMNLNGRISILYSFAWGIIAILFINFVYPFFERILNKVLSKIPYKVQLFTLLRKLFCFFLFRTPTVRWGYVTMQFAQVNFFVPEVC